MQKRWLTSYDPGVPHSLEYPEVPLYSAFLERAGEHPDAEALVFGDSRRTYGSLAGEVRDFAAGLNAYAPARKGDRVGIFLPNCPEMVVAYYGVLMTGASAVMLSPELVERELADMVAGTAVRTLVCPDEYLPRLATAVREAGLERAVVTPRGDRQTGGIPASSTPSVPGLETVSFSSLVQAGAAEPAAPGMAPDGAATDPREDVAVLIYTGGTTGMPKAVMLTHFALVANATQLASWVSLGPGDVALAVLPMYHSYGMSTGMNAPLLAGSSVVVLPDGEPGAMLEAIERERPTLLVGVPAMFAALVDHPRVGEADLSSLKYCFVGAATLPRDVRARFEELSGAALLEGYGLTEAVTAQSAGPARGARKPGSIGIPFPDVEFRVVDIETGTKELLPEKAGELIMMSPCLMKGYHDRPAETAKAIRDGWLFTSDIGWMDHDGYFYVIDRKKDLVISGAFKAYPAEVESVLLTHPDIVEAAVVGLFDDFRGHSLKAFVVLEEGAELTAEEVLQFCRQNMSEYKVPRAVEFRTELPRSSFGKILRRELE